MPRFLQTFAPNINQVNTNRMNRINTSVRRLLFVVSCILAGSIFVMSCTKDPEPTPDPALAITSISPGAGNAGAVITITGTGFDGTTPASNSVTFGTTTATVLASTPTTIVTQVPGGITGNFPITVSRTGKGTVTSTTQFNVTTTLAKPVVTISGIITANTNWTANNIYLLTDFVYVASGATLTIAPGTVIKGDKLSKGTLVIEPGARINAQGTASNPIIFTSNLAPGLRNLGDWGGLVICGRAPHNLATGVTDVNNLPIVEGGARTRVSALTPDPADNSGVLSYVRIEWAGVALSPNNELNGLSLYAVGSGTKIDHVQVSYANDDSIEWFGGNVNMSHLVAYRGLDDDFDTDNGYAGNVQFGLGVRDLTLADQSGSKGFESDNSGAGSFNQLPQTSCVFSNFTLIGPAAVSTAGGSMTSVVNTSTPASAPSANYVSAMHIRRNSAKSVFNSITLGWPAGLLLDNALTAANLAAGRSVIANNIIGGNLVGAVNGVTGSRDIIYISTAGAGSLTPINALGPDSTGFGAAIGPVTYLRVNNNRRLAGSAAFGLTDPYNLVPNVVPATGSAALTGAAYTNAKLSSAFFDKTPTFVGAASAASNFTTEAWVNFTPQTVVYQ